MAWRSSGMMRGDRAAERVRQLRLPNHILLVSQRPRGWRPDHPIACSGDPLHPLLSQLPPSIRLSAGSRRTIASALAKAVVTPRDEQARRNVFNWASDILEGLEGKATALFRSRLGRNVRPMSRNGPLFGCPRGRAFPRRLVRRWRRHLHPPHVARRTQHTRRRCVDGGLDSTRVADFHCDQASSLDLEALAGSHETMYNALAISTGRHPAGSDEVQFEGGRRERGCDQRIG